jgi:hypothetical protein
MKNSRLTIASGDGFVNFNVDGERVGHIHRGDTTGTNRSGSRRVTWYGELNLSGFKRPYKPSGTKTNVTQSLKQRIRAWLNPPQEIL